MRVAVNWSMLARAAVLGAGIGAAWTSCVAPELRATNPKYVRFIAFNALFVVSFLLLIFTAARRMLIAKTECRIVP